MRIPLCVLIVQSIIISCTSFHNHHVFTPGHKHLTRSRATPLSNEKSSVDEDDEILSPLGKLLLKRNDVMGYNADTFPPRDRPTDGQTTKRQMAWPFQQFEAPPLLDGSLACDCGFDPLGIAKSQKELFALREAGSIAVWLYSAETTLSLLSDVDNEPPSHHQIHTLTQLYTILT